MRLFVVLIVAFALFVSGAAAESGTIEAGDTLHAELNDGIFINVPGEFNFTTFSITSGQLQFWLNNSRLQWRTNTNKTLTNIQFITSADNFTFNANGTDGYLNFSSKMNYASNNYSFYLDDVFQEYVTSDSDKIVTLNYSGAWSDHVFLIAPTAGAPPNLVNFTFSNSALSESQIYQTSQSTRISVDVNDSDGYISSVVVGITFLGVEFNYSMSGGNDTWIYDFSTGVTGTYYISNFYATDNLDGTNSTISSLSFVVVPVSAGGGGGYPLPTPTPTPIITPAPTPYIPPVAPIDTFRDAVLGAIPKELREADNVPEGVVKYWISLPDPTKWSVMILSMLFIVFTSEQKKKKRNRRR